MHSKAMHSASNVDSFSCSLVSNTDTDAEDICTPPALSASKRRSWAPGPHFPLRCGHPQPPGDLHGDPC